MPDQNRPKHRLRDARRRGGWHCRINSAGILVAEWHGQVRFAAGAVLTDVFITDYLAESQPK